MKRILILSGLALGSVVSFYFLPHGTWDAIGDLPAHPLIVHGAVVLLPAASLLLFLGAVKPEFLRKWQTPIFLLLLISTLAVLMAKSSGDSLSAAVGLPEFHAEWGNNLVPLAIALVLATIILLFVSFYREIPLISKFMRAIVGILSVATIAMTFVVGHSGAESVWKDEYASAKVPLAFSLGEYTAEEVAKHNSADDCWTIVDGHVYDVTTFARRHPAGPKAIAEMCGVNASEDFLGEHGGQSEPESWLETLKIGTLK
jgi:hypothetical protein